VSTTSSRNEAYLTLTDLGLFFSLRCTQTIVSYKSSESPTMLVTDYDDASIMKCERPNVSVCIAVTTA
jgi:hypothetical protein